MPNEITGFPELIKFWFEEIKPADWWKKSDSFDGLLRERYSGLHARAAQCELYTWREQAEGRLAEIIILDQFSRNMYRDTPQAFATDPMSLTLAQEAVAAGADGALNSAQKSFMYMPFMHSESLEIHEVAVELFRKSGNQDSLEFEYRHKRIIEKFGRYPHRNKILGRQSSPEEIEFLKQPGSGF